MTKAVYLDLDGTLCNCEHRRHHVETGNWPGFFAGMCDDTIITHTETALRALHAAGYAIIIGSARPDENNYRQMTTEWLDRHNIPYSAIYLRDGGDYRKDSIVKVEILERMLNDGWDIQFAFDDRDQVVRAFRDYGLPVFQVNDGDFDNKQPRFVKENHGKEMLHMMIGPSGAGKSTLIEARYRKEDVISSDEVRRQLFGSHDANHVHNPDNLALTWAYVHKLIQARLECGLFTVLDSTGLRRKDRLAVLDLVPKGYLVRYVIVDRDYDEKIRDRGWRPVTLIDKHHQSFKSALKDVLKADDQGNVVVEDTRNRK
jgi:predicted kinase